jgi:outer membrane protein assembly factor BamA
VGAGLLIFNRKLKFALPILALLFQRKTFSQSKPDTSKKVHALIIPIAFRTPETGFAYGLANSIYFKTSFLSDSSIRMSTIQNLIFFTSRKQNVQAIDAAVYFPKEKFILMVQLSHSFFPDRFWGIGPNSKNKFDQYEFQQVFVNPHLKKKIRKHVFAGALYEFQRIYNIGYNPGGEFDSSIIYGKSPHNVSGAGLSFAYDSRNSTFWPQKGVFLQTLVTGFNKDILISDYTFLKCISDFRFFKRITKNHILAFQLYNYQTYGQVPFRQLATFGGPNNLRGFYQGRFRDNNMVSFITEYRLIIKNRLGAVLFGGVGNVYNNISDLAENTVKYSYGGGLRFALLKKERLNVRMDYGYSSKFNRGLYFTIGECF